MSNTEKQDKKSIKTKLADPETYLEIISDCMSDEQKKDLSPHHVANVMALSAELLLTYAGPIGRSFQDQGELDVTLKAKLGTMKDTVQIQFKRAAELKDSASAEVPDPDQTQMDFKGGDEVDDVPGEVDDDDIPMPLKVLPAPSKGLPEPIDAEVVEGDERGPCEMCGNTQAAGAYSDEEGDTIELCGDCAEAAQAENANKGEEE